MPTGLTFGLTNGPEDFQEMVFIAFRKRLYSEWYLFLDDLAVATGRPPSLPPGPSGADDVIGTVRGATAGERALDGFTRASGSGGARHPVAHVFAKGGCAAFGSPGSAVWRALKIVLAGVIAFPAFACGECGSERTVTTGSSGPGSSESTSRFSPCLAPCAIAIPIANDGARWTAVALTRRGGAITRKIGSTRGGTGSGNAYPRAKRMPSSRNSGKRGWRSMSPCGSCTKLADCLACGTWQLTWPSPASEERNLHLSGTGSGM